ncbi:AraC family transcriptional regulator [Actinoplanes sp. N902-109]|uniref:AraC family transcriptional regulator n=1 Tax=Actinoplanes sp. (strain N902-109) TaxID=649831 RepID=UPI0003294F88|nr:AraC family transcriptional regulator [Actinoplanes sp. N902-109]AGL17563.1 AraC family transcriptional regulator [Actinoplanes sp. N902-109]
METAAAAVITREPPGTQTSARAVLRTGDFDEASAFCRRMFYGPLRMKPTGDAAGLAFFADVVQLGPMTFGEVSYGVEVCAELNDLRTAYHVLAPLTGAVHVLHRGVATTADPGRAAVFQPGGEIELRWSADCRAVNVKVDRLVFERELAVQELPTPAPPTLGATFGLAGGAGRSWMGLIRLLHSEIREPDGLTSLPRLLSRWSDLAITTLATAVEQPDGAEAAGLPTARRPRPVKRALDAMHAEPDRAFTAHELASIAGVGVRVLQESFRRHVGVSPLTYLRRLRLEGVHAELLRSDRGEVSVSEVAHRWGFTHLGRFAGAYRDRYGVSPSETLRDRG